MKGKAPQNRSRALVTVLVDILTVDPSDPCTKKTLYYQPSTELSLYLSLLLLLFLSIYLIFLFISVIAIILGVIVNFLISVFNLILISINIETRTPQLGEALSSSSWHIFRSSLEVASSGSLKQSGF